MATAVWCQARTGARCRAPAHGRRPAGLLPARASYHLLYGLPIVLAMAYPSPSLAEHVAHGISVGDHETKVPLASYHGSQRKYYHKCAITAASAGIFFMTPYQPSYKPNVTTPRWELVPFNLAGSVRWRVDWLAGHVICE
eukprot:3524560-Pyramimonas_sp.AAC.1